MRDHHPLTRLLSLADEHTHTGIMECTQTPHVSHPPPTPAVLPQSGSYASILTSLELYSPYFTDDAKNGHFPEKVFPILQDFAALHLHWLALRVRAAGCPGML